MSCRILPILFTLCSCASASPDSSNIQATDDAGFWRTQSVPNWQPVESSQELNGGYQDPRSDYPEGHDEKDHVPTSPPEKSTPKGPWSNPPVPPGPWDRLK